MGDIQRFNNEIRRTREVLRDSDALMRQAMNDIADRSRCVWVVVVLASWAGAKAWRRWQGGRSLHQDQDQGATSKASQSPGAWLLGLVPFALQHVVLPRLPLPWRLWGTHPMVLTTLRRWLRV